jgi:sulfhydrogenase subunit beta (sulfur reductase)
MPVPTPEPVLDSAVVEASALGALVAWLRARGYTVVGPTVRDDAVVLAELGDADDLPRGWGVRAEAGSYRLVRRADDAVFAHSAGPRSVKSFLHPPRRRLLRLDRPDQERGGQREEAALGGGLGAAADDEPLPRYAFLGIHPCDLAAIGVLDGVLRDPVPGPGYPDPDYTARRDGVFVVVANCTEPGGTCFCVSMGGGPRARGGYDLALTERIDQRGHRFLAEAGSPAGQRALAALAGRPATERDEATAAADLRRAAERMGRRMPDVDLRELLAASRTSPHWQDVGSRCLGCANCTMVCPTCFCTTVDDVTDVTGQHAERWQRWDSCFNLDFSYVHGGEVRRGVDSRYRQWMSHKLSTWYDQFGGSGCVGCGRCITWCPVGIDITAEAAALAERAQGGDGGRDGGTGDG